MLNKILFAFLSAAILSCVSCNSEQDDLAKGQDCLDNVDENNPTSADACLEFVAKYDSQQAQILKCSIYMTSGGLVENKIVAAYKALKEEGQTNKHATYMAILSLDQPTALLALPKAKAANTFCQASGVPGLMYLSSAILAGTSINATIEDLTGNGIDINDPAGMNTAITNMLNKCTDPTTVSPDLEKCEANLATMGEATVALASSYCDSTEADQDVCAQINGATEAAGNDTSKVGQALLCYLKDLHYDAVSGNCQ